MSTRDDRADLLGRVVKIAAALDVDGLLRLIQAAARLRDGRSGGHSTCPTCGAARGAALSRGPHPPKQRITAAGRP